MPALPVPPDPTVFVVTPAGPTFLVEVPALVVVATLGFGLLTVGFGLVDGATEAGESWPKRAGPMNSAKRRTRSDEQDD